MPLTTVPLPANIAVMAYHYGPHSTPLPATTKNVGSPSNTAVRRLVRLHDQPSGLPLFEMWSDAMTGAFQFVGLRAGTFYVIAFDHTGQYNGVIETDIVLPAPGA